MVCGAGVGAHLEQPDSILFIYRDDTVRDFSGPDIDVDNLKEGRLCSGFC